MSFIRSFDIEKIKRMTGESAALFERLKADVHAGEVFPAVRKDELHFYYKGGCLYKFTCEDLTSVSIPDSVTSIGDGAFSDCTSLTSITIPDSVTSIGDGAFSDCTSLTSITIPDSVTSIGDLAFSGCTSLTSITIPDSVTSIGDGAFYGCSSLTSITIPDSVTSIGYGAFSGCTSLTSITIPDSVTSIGDRAFSGCSSLTSITIPDSVTSIGDGAFSGCTGLTSITIPDSATSIGDWAFSGCTSLTSITIPDSVTSIGDGAFSGCSSLTSITIPDSVTSIGDRAFSGCSSLTSITIPDSVTSIGDWAFYGCSSLTSITIPDSVTSIGDGAFSGCTSLTSITIPDSVTSIGDHAFSGCTSLTSITIPDSATSIGAWAFSYCSSLTSIEVSVDNINYKSIEGVLFNKAGTELIQYPIGNSKTSYDIPISVTSIGDGAFSGCTSLTSITIPDSVTSIGYGAFSYCSSLTSIEVSVDNINYKSIEGVLFNKAGTELIQYPIGNSKTSYDIPISVTSIGDGAFSGCSSLTSITIPDSVTSIGYGAFYGCSSLTSITIPDSVTSIGDYAFEDCTSLTSITIPDSVTSIGNYAFYGCSSLTIHAEASSKLDGWADMWNLDNRPVVWGHQGENAKYTITFNSNGGGSVTAITKEAGVSITAPTAPTKTGYTFGGWYTDNGTFANVYTFSTMPEESFTLYAKWIDDNQEQQGAYQRINASGVPTADGDYILFGEYPQTIKATDVTVSTTADSRGYYLGSDGYYYAKVTATPHENSYNFSTGTTVSNGTVYYFKVEPIKWRILEESDGTALILCESIIANKRYHASSNNYMNSEIRAWLNNEFYNTAFSALQKELIQVTNVDNSVDSTGFSSNPYACANTNDKIFLPSYREMCNTSYGFNSSASNYDLARERLTSDYSRATGAYMNTDTTYYGTGWWWLRSPSGSHSYFERNIYDNGYAALYNSVYSTNKGVVPALKIRLS